MAGFELHPRLAADTLPIGAFDLCRVLLMDDARYPWCILVPERAEVTEIHQLHEDDQVRLIRESSRLAASMAELFAADKMNVAALGNVVPQLHLHVVARSIGDPAWPGPVWGVGDPEAYTAEAGQARIALIQDAFGEWLQGV